MNVAITDSGAIVLDRVVCDGYHPEHSVRIITHAHADHLWGLEESIRKGDLIYSTPATKDLLKVLRGVHSPLIKTADYEEPFSHETDTITLFPSSHILGSAQVLVETKNGDRYVYSSDFVYEKIRAIKCDILVLDATYGHPSCVRPPIRKAKASLIKLVQTELEYNKQVIILGFYGKLQEVMRILHEAGAKVPFINPPKVFLVSKIYEKYGIRLGRVYSSLSGEGREIMKSQQFIGFYHPTFKPKIDKNTTLIHLTGWQFEMPYKKIREREYVVSWSGHSDFNQLIKYVEECEPKLVITDNARPGSAQRLAEEIKARLGIEAKPEPPRNTN